MPLLLTLFIIMFFLSSPGGILTPVYKPLFIIKTRSLKNNNRIKFYMSAVHIEGTNK